MILQHTLLDWIMVIVPYITSELSVVRLLLYFLIVRMSLEFFFNFNRGSIICTHLFNIFFLFTRIVNTWRLHSLQWHHTISMASQFISNSTVCSGWYKRKHQCSISPSICEGNTTVTGIVPSQSSSDLERVSLYRNTHSRINLCCSWVQSMFRLLTHKSHPYVALMEKAWGVVLSSLEDTQDIGSVLYILLRSFELGNVYDTILA